MISITSSTIQDRSRLVGLLTELSATKFNSAGYNLAERLSQLIGLSDSVTLARALQQLPHEVSNPTVGSARSMQEEVLAGRERIMCSITSSFDHETADAQIKVPSASIGIRAGALQTYEPYKRFYTTHQVEMAVAVQSLRVRVRKGMSAVSTELYQLAELDRTLDESLLAQNGKLFNLTPKILEQRFNSLLQTHRQTLGDAADKEPSQWIIHGGWLELFYRDMRELLLAEFDVRLQPVLGLLEALNEYTQTTS